MRDYQSLTDTTWDCKYPVVFIPKRRKKAIFGAIRKHLGRVLHELAQQKGRQIVEGHAWALQHAAAEVMGYCDCRITHYQSDLQNYKTCRRGMNPHM